MIDKEKYYYNNNNAEALNHTLTTTDNSDILKINDNDYFTDSNVTLINFSSSPLFVTEIGGTWNWSNLMAMNPVDRAALEERINALIDKNIDFGEPLPTKPGVYKIESAPNNSNNTINISFEFGPMYFVIRPNKVGRLYQDLYDDNLLTELELEKKLRIL